ncbi:MAG: PTS fructose transporter subunit IIB [Xanthomonadales bacterium]|nr:PTS fructose transporter subunit IIB [Xanthomonadales bacterium]
MFIVCVTACPTGIAHTFMAAESLQKHAGAKGIEIKVETQGSLGIDNEIETADIERADGVIIAAAVAIEGAERFEGLPFIECSVEDPIGEGEAVIDALLDEIEKAG